MGSNMATSLNLAATRDHLECDCIAIRKLFGYTTDSLIISVNPIDVSVMK